ncbi:signal peptidase II [Georgenia faecalis]|uniref:signal peptidase II n=1 Tax=Georgenia faecalis TaxID=2483799 RepID=UPI000FD9831B
MSASHKKHATTAPDPEPGGVAAAPSAADAQPAPAAAPAPAPAQDAAPATAQDAAVPGADPAGAPSQAPPSPRTGRRSRTALLTTLIAIAAGLAVADQVTKYLAEANLVQGVVVPVLGDVLSLQLIYNPGAAFSIATGMTWVFTLVAVVVIAVVVRASRRIGSLAWAIALGMLLGGSLGNLYDRLLREPGFARGHVVDFINYNGWFVGNVADIAIVAAAVLVAVLAVRGVEIDGTVVGRDTPAPESAPAEDVAPEEPDDADVDVAAWVASGPAADAPARTPATVTGPALHAPVGASPADDAATDGGPGDDVLADAPADDLAADATSTHGAPAEADAPAGDVADAAPDATTDGRDPARPTRDA